MNKKLKFCFLAFFAIGLLIFSCFTEAQAQIDCGCNSSQTAKIAGYVLDSYSLSAPNQTVWVFPLSDPEPNANLMTGTTNSNGYFEFTEGTSYPPYNWQLGDCYVYEITIIDPGPYNYILPEHEYAKTSRTNSECQDPENINFTFYYGEQSAHTTVESLIKQSLRF